MAMTRACGSSCVGVGLELDALLEVDQVQLDLVGAVAQGEVGDQGVQQRRFAGAGLAGDEHVLRRCPGRARRCCRLRRAGPAERHVRCRVRLSPVHHSLRRRRDELERHLDAAGVLGRLADLRAECGWRSRRPAAASSVSGIAARNRRPSRGSAGRPRRTCARCSAPDRRGRSPCGSGCLVSTLTSV